MWYDSVSLYLVLSLPQKVQITQPWSRQNTVYRVQCEHALTVTYLPISWHSWLMISNGRLKCFQSNFMEATLAPCRYHYHVKEFFFQIFLKPLNTQGFKSSLLTFHFIYMGDKLAAHHICSSQLSSGTASQRSPISASCITKRNMGNIGQLNKNQTFTVVSVVIVLHRMIRIVD